MNAWMPDCSVDIVQPPKQPWWYFKRYCDHFISKLSHLSNICKPSILPSYKRAPPNKLTSEEIKILQVWKHLTVVKLNHIAMTCCDYYMLCCFLEFSWSLVTTMIISLPCWTSNESVSNFNTFNNLPWHYFKIQLLHRYWLQCYPMTLLVGVWDNNFMDFFTLPMFNHARSERHFLSIHKRFLSIFLFWCMSCFLSGWSSKIGHHLIQFNNKGQYIHKANWFWNIGDIIHFNIKMMPYEFPLLGQHDLTNVLSLLYQESYIWKNGLNSLLPTDAICRYRSGSTLAQVMACCLTAPSHYLNQCRLIISEVLRHSSQGNFTWNANDIYPWLEFENY